MNSNPESFRGQKSVIIRQASPYILELHSYHVRNGDELSIVLLEVTSPEIPCLRYYLLLSMLTNLAPFVQAWR
jgi:hypothetical protein